MGSREIQSSTGVPPRDVFSQSTRRLAQWRPGAAFSVTVAAIRCPMGIMGNSHSSILTTRMLPLGPSNAFQHSWEPRPLCQSPRDSRNPWHHQASGHITRNPPKPLELHVAPWHCRQKCPALLPCTLGPLQPSWLHGLPLPNLLPREMEGGRVNKSQGVPRPKPASLREGREYLDHPACWLQRPGLWATPLLVTGNLWPHLGLHP